MRFNSPDSALRVALPPVSEEAIHLMRALLSDREKRLSCRAYRDNDVERRHRSRHLPHNGHTSNVSFVCDNDAADIKAHPFFQDIEWDALHVTDPPWKPRIQDTSTYFGESTEDAPWPDNVLKRPRDKILRDPVVADQAMEIRQTAGFLGYTFRRCDFELEDEEYAVAL